VHRDVKPQNVLLDVHLTAKLGDVGLAKFMTRPIDSLIRYGKRRALRGGGGRVERVGSAHTWFS
jgi:serine/threonine protein kinase